VKTLQVCVEFDRALFSEDQSPIRSIGEMPCPKQLEGKMPLSPAPALPEQRFVEERPSTSREQDEDYWYIPAIHIAFSWR